MVVSLTLGFMLCPFIKLYIYIPICIKALSIK